MIRIFQYMGKYKFSKINTNFNKYFSIRNVLYTDLKKNIIYLGYNNAYIYNILIKYVCNTYIHDTHAYLCTLYSNIYLSQMIVKVSDVLFKLAISFLLTGTLRLEHCQPLDLLAQGMNPLILD